MEAVRDAWTDDRLDDLNHRVDDGFKEMRTEFRAVRSELGGQIEAVRSDLGSQIAALHRTMLQLFGGMFATFVIGIFAILTQL
jgi:hypothetical protein